MTEDELMTTPESFQATFKFETAAAIQQALYAELLQRQQLEVRGFKQPIEEWNRNIKPFFDFLSNYVEDHK